MLWASVEIEVHIALGTVAIGIVLATLLLGWFCYRRRPKNRLALYTYGQLAGARPRAWVWKKE